MLFVLVVLQLAFLSPVAFPILKTDAGPGWTRLLLARFAMTMVVVAPLAYAGSVARNFFGWDIKDPFFDNAISNYPQLIIGGLAIIVGPVVTFVLRRRWKAGVPVRHSAIIAGLLCGLLIGGITMTVFGMLDNFTSMDTSRSSVEGFLLRAIVFGLPVVGWLVWTPILLRFARRRDSDAALDVLARRLLLGTIVEIAAIIPFDIMVRRKTDCYCFEPTFFALLACGSVGFVVMGPAIFLIVGRRRTRWMQMRCPECEYDMSGFPHALICPECGSGWTLANRKERE
jgi:hypothetical protein